MKKGSIDGEGRDCSRKGRARQGRVESIKISRDETKDEDGRFRTRWCECSKGDKGDLVSAIFEGV